MAVVQAETVLLPLGVCILTYVADLCSTAYYPYFLSWFGYPLTTLTAIQMKTFVPHCFLTYTSLYMAPSHVSSISNQTGTTQDRLHKSLFDCENWCFKSLFKRTPPKLILLYQIVRASTRFIFIEIDKCVKCI